jgi:lipopolysaccharide export LptBFGC system permease protein LptF
MRRGGRAAAIGASIGAVLAQYLLLRAGEVLAQRGVLPVPLALQLSNLVLFAVGLALCWLLERRGPGVVR